jgi:sulfide:quinone oxidoreductase
MVENKPESDGAVRRVVIAGGGVAGLEAALALRDLAGPRVQLTLVAPERRFVYRPLSVGEPFALGAAQSVALDVVAHDLDAHLVHDALAEVDAERRVARLREGEIGYDTLLVATGARRVPAYAHATSFRGQEDSEAMHGVIQDLEGGFVTRVAFVVPPGVAWPLPIYELALMTAQRAKEMSLHDVELTVVTPEEAPLIIFGSTASAAVRERLVRAGVRIETGVSAQIPDARTVIMRPGGGIIRCERVVALSEIEPIRIPGLPADASGFVAVDAHGRAQGVADVYAAGDGTSFPVKQGGIACQLADAAAEAIASDAGVPLKPRPMRPVLRGELLTGERPLYLRTDISGTAGDVSDASGHTLWWPPSKIAGDYLAPYLEARERAAIGERVRPAGIRRVAPPEHPALAGHGIDLLGIEFEQPQPADAGT